MFAFSGQRGIQGNVTYWLRKPTKDNESLFPGQPEYSTGNAIQQLPDLSVVEILSVLQ